MIRRLPILAGMMLFLALMLLVVGQWPARAESPNAWTIADVNLRSGPGTTFGTVTTLPASTPLVLDARNKDTSWVIVHTVDNSARGWAKTTLLKVSRDVSLYHLPVADETIQVGDAASAAQGTPVAMPTLGPDLHLTAPVLPVVTNAMRTMAHVVMAKGRELGNNPRVFSKVGDCMTDHWAFLNVISYKKYDLAKYGNLQAVIDQFSISPRDGQGDSFAMDSRAAHNGFNSAAVLDWQFNNIKSGPAICLERESSLRCELRVSKPSVAIIMFGTADVLVMTPEQFNFFMRTIIRETMDQGVIPLLSTFPENKGVPDASRRINQVILTIAREKNLPLINLQEALKNLPNNGIDTDGIHLTIPPNGASGYFTPENLKYGYTVRNLVTLQALDIVWRQLMNQ